MKKIFNFIGRQKYKLAALMGAAVIAGSGYTLYTYFQIKDSVTSYTLSEPIIIYDMDEKVVDSLSPQKGENADIEDIPEDVKNAFIAVEDKRFYSHGGIDFRRLGGALAANLAKGRISQGGSTISQQLAKNAFLSNERTFSRKFKEMIITFEIERLYSKDQILEKYLNEIYFGSGSYGVREAAADIFGKDIEDINLPEAAMIAGIPNRPAAYNPRSNLDNALKRSHLILRLMHEQGLIDDGEYNRALHHHFILEQNKPKNFKKRRDTSVIVKDGRQKRESAKAPDFTDIVEDKLTEYVDVDIVSKGGLKVYTTLDSNMQKIARKEFNSYSYIRKNSKLQGAMITLDAHTGEVRSIVGGRNYSSGNFNRAVNTKKQIGSTFKPFVYYTALEKGYTMNQIVDASSKTYGKWTPKNYGNARYKSMTLLESMEKSVNTVAVRLMQDVGVSNVRANFESTGTGVVMEDNLTSALGSMSASPLELAASYLPFANGGTSHIPSFIVRIEDANGNILYERSEPLQVQGLDSVNTALTTFMMKDVVAHGSGRGAQVKTKMGFSLEQGGKTGTSNDFRAAWYAGFTPDYVTVVYMGYDDNSPMPSGSSGGRLGAPLWKNFYQELIDEGHYRPGSFDFISDELSNGELVSRNMDIRSGEVGRPPKEFRREILFKKDQVPEGGVTKFFKGVKRSTKGFLRRLFD